MSNRKQKAIIICIPIDFRTNLQLKFKENMRYSQEHLYHNLVWEVCQNMLINDTIKLKINCFGSSEQIFSTEQHSQVTIIHIVSTTMLKYCVFYQNERAWLTGSIHTTHGPLHQ